MTLWWGNIVVAAYVLRAAGQADGDWSRFFLGRRAGIVPAAPLSAPVRALCGLAALAVLIWTGLSVQAVGFAPIATFGYVMGFAPVVLSLLLLAFPSQTARRFSGDDHVRADI